MVLGLLFVFALVQFQDVAATQQNSDDTYGSTDPIAFKFSDDEATAAVPSDDVTISESFWSQVPTPADNNESETLSDDSFADVDGANTTFVDSDGFDMVEADDADASTAG